MDIQITTASVTELTGDWLIAPVYEGSEFSETILQLDTALQGQLSRLAAMEDLTGKLGETIKLLDVPDIAGSRVLVVGLGKADALTVAGLEKAAMTAVREISGKVGTSVSIILPTSEQLSAETVAEVFTTASIVGSVGQAFHKAKPKRHQFESVTLHTSGDQGQTEAGQVRGQVLGECMNITRELVNRPAEEVYPESFAEQVEEMADGLDLSCRILGEDQLEDEMMLSMLAVAQGSERPARLVVLEYKGAAEDSPTLALCGKGVTFDSGGLSLKPNDSMLTMKCDMAGAATVVGSMLAISMLQLHVNVTGYMGLVENMPSGTAFKLGDILRARNGVTIEVGNTDAEGRLVLADVLSYAVDEGADYLVDLATLTGACVVALGENVTGAFTNQEEWCAKLLASAKTTGEDVWQLPMFDQYNELIESEVADVKNTGGRWGGAITAAKFLEHFVSGTPWVHLDIAGPSFASGNKPHREGGATACMVRTLVELAAQFES